MEKIKTFTLPETRFLSNFYPHKKDGTKFPHLVRVIYNEITFDCVENAYQAAKSLDAALQRKMLKMSPYETKFFWEDKKEEIRSDCGDVYWGVDIETGKGENNLGKILMSLREKFKK